jgi:hypothetical protein
MFVVEDDERNECDQRKIEFALLDRFGIRVVRRSLSTLANQVCGGLIHQRGILYSCVFLSRVLFLFGSHFMHCCLKKIQLSNNYLKINVISERHCHG